MLTYNTVLQLQKERGWRKVRLIFYSTTAYTHFTSERQFIFHDGVEREDEQILGYLRDWKNEPTFRFTDRSTLRVVFFTIQKKNQKRKN